MFRFILISPVFSLVLDDELTEEDRISLQIGDDPVSRQMKKPWQENCTSEAVAEDFLQVHYVKRLVKTGDIVDSSLIRPAVMWRLNRDVRRSFSSFTWNLHRRTTTNSISSRRRC